MSIQTLLFNRRVVDFIVCIDRKTLRVGECCDFYFSTDLTKDQVAQLIVELQSLHDEMVPS